MATEVTLPELGESVTEGTITEWLVEVGDEVNEDDPLFELSSDKIDTEVPSPASGVLKEIKVDVDETVEVGTVVAIIGDPDEDAGGDDTGDDTEAADDAADQPDDTGDEAAQAEADTDEAEADTDEAEADTDEAEADTDEAEADTDEAEADTDEAEADTDEADADTDEAEADTDEAEADTDEADADTDEAEVEGDEDGGTDAAGDDVEVTLPELGESVTEGTITEWLVEVGDEVDTDDPLFELSSDKIDTEVPSPASGVLKEIKVDVDETVEVGTVVAIIGSGGDRGQQTSEDTDAGADQATADAGTDGEDDRGDEEAGGTGRERAASSGNGGVAGGDALMSPIVRRMIAEHDLDPATIEGSGQGGRITRDDVEAAIGGGGTAAAEKADDAPKKEAPKKAAQPSKSDAGDAGFEAGERERVEKLSRIRQRIAAKMQESLTNTAQLTTVQEADMTHIMRLRAQHKDDFKQREGASLSPFAFLARAAILAIKRHPTVNAKVDWDAGEVLYRDYVNLGIAVDTEKGLLVPNVKNADDLTLAALARNIADVAGKARGKGQLEMSDIQGGTFTVTNTGSRGVLIDTPILNYPEVAILGTGAIQKRAKVVNDGLGDTIAVRDLVYLCLTYDHQILDGADAARYVTDIKEVVETHDWEAELGI